MEIAVFAYGSLVSRPSAELTLGRAVPVRAPAALRGYGRGFTLIRDNRRCEKTFARRDDGWVPDHVLALNLDPGVPEQEVNGALIDVSVEELADLDRRELRYRRIDVTERIGDAAAAFGRVYTYVARGEHHAPVPPVSAVVLSSYERTVEEAFAGLGAGELGRYRETTDRGEAERIDAYLLTGEIPARNPRAW
ncbi:MAG: gamma-glutamylcyclotransferase family protein [Solirubrobacterales bacterium]